MQGVSEWFHVAIGSQPVLTRRLIISVSLLLLITLLRWLALRVVERQVGNERQRYRARKTLTYVAFGFSVLVIGRVWFEGFASLTTFLGLVSAGLAIALKDLVVNLAGWIFIMWRRPFEVGDRIQIGDHAGDVIDIRVFQFTLLEVGNWVKAEQSTGRVIHVPNGMVFQKAQANYDKGFRYIWNEIPVLVTFESDWKKAKGILRTIADRHEQQLSAAAQEKIRKASRKFLIYYSHLTPTVYTSVVDCGVLLTIRYLCEPRRRRGTEQDLWEEILDEFSLHSDIDFAYPTQRFFDHRAEGKVAGPSPDSASHGSP